MRFVLILFLALNTLAAGRELAPRPEGRTAYAPQSPLVAYAGGRYLTVWLESLDRAGWRILGTFSDAAGRRLSPSAFVLVPYGIAGPGHLIGTGDSFAIFWPLDDGLLMMDIDLGGRVTATRIVPVPHARHFPSVAWNGTHFAASARDRVVLFDRAGSITRSIDLPCRPAMQRVLAAGAELFAAAACDGAGLQVHRIAADGSLTTTLLDPSFTAASGLRVVAAPANDSVLFAWVVRDAAGEILKSALLSAEPMTIAHGDSASLLTPLILAKTPDGFLLPYSFHGNLRFAKLRGDGSPLGLDEGPQLSGGFGLSAATDGTAILVADLRYDLPLSRGNIRTRHVDADAHVSAPELLSIVPARQSAPVLAAGSGSLLAAWTEMQGVTSIVKAAHLDAGGMPLRDTVVVPNASLWTEDLAWNGGEYLTLIASDGRLRAQRITAFGDAAAPATVLGDLPLTVPPQSSVIWAGDRWLVAWTDGREAFLASLTSTGALTAVRTLPLAGTLSEQDSRSSIGDVALAFDGSRLLIAWIEGQTPQCRVTCLEQRPVFVARMTRDGALLDAVPLRVGHESAIFASLSMSMRDGEAVLVANGDYGSLIAAIDARATLRLTASTPFEGSGDVTRDGADFVLAIRERDRLTLRRVDAQLQETVRARITSVLPQDAQQPPSIAAAFSGNAIAGTQECDARGGRAVAYAERELVYESPRRRSIRP